MDTEKMEGGRRMGGSERLAGGRSRARTRPWQHPREDSRGDADLQQRGGGAPRRRLLSSAPPDATRTRLQPSQPSTTRSLATSSSTGGEQPGSTGGSSPPPLLLPAAHGCRSHGQSTHLLRAWCWPALSTSSPAWCWPAPATSSPAADYLCQEVPTCAKRSWVQTLSALHFAGAADYLGHQGLLDQTCQTVAQKIHAMSPYEIRRKFNIRTDLNKNRSGVKPDLDQDKVLTLAQNALKALHIVRYQRFTAYDPERKAFICTRFCSYNTAFFDLDKESILVPGPPLDKLNGHISTSSVQSAVNVISLKVTKSDVGKKLNVFGTVIARDQVDYRCLFLFNRGEADAQTISLPDGMLTLTGPCRGLVLSDEIIFEMDLKIKHDGYIEDFSRGLISFERVRLLADEQQTMTLGLNSWLSRVELTCAHVVHPVEATIAISILKGPCNLSGVAAWNAGNREDCIILYDSEADGTQTVSGNGGGLVPLSRCLVAVPVDTKLVLHLVGDESAEQVFVTLGQSDDQLVCKMGLGEVQVKVAWTCILKRRRYKLKVLGDECMLH